MNGESDYVQFSSDTQACINSIPEVSREKYKKAYKSFTEWQKENNLPSNSENVLLAYFDELSKKFKSSTLWAQYSMLRTMMNINDNIDIGNYCKVRAFLKRNSCGYRPKKSKIFSSDEIDNFINNAPDEFYLLDKVLLIMGIMGASRRDELYKMKTTDCRDLGSAAVLVRIPNRKTNVSRKFTLTGLFYDVYKKYRELRPAEVGHNYFFLNYQKTKCSVQRVGINKIGYTGKRIAEYLKLPNPELYTGHCFRRSSGTIPPGRGLRSLKRYGCWNLQTLEESDDEESMNEKIDSGSGITTRRATKAFQSVERQTNQHDDHEATQSDHSENSRTSTPTKLGGNKENSRKNQKRPVDASAINDVIRKLRKISDDCNQYSNEFDVFCDSLAIQLKKMPIDRALICQEKLQSVMTQERLYQVTQTEQSNSYDYDQSQIAGSSNTYQYMKSSPPPDPEDKPGYYSET
ncbi:uncharacterized protein LOC123307256 isoform X2 [Coccinella septempunctata]|uniref:uncharacterized protein LOC123307256 isoform X2 n=1 Tax=Coccinella septempunctata TaxID=41139 RepID=UPI001D097E40|nr:uncharacterized protein LOC123307256 isoform X2 [Coccinella septempunctata]